MSHALLLIILAFKDSLNITDSKEIIDGSVTSYFITYNVYSTDELCGSNNVTATSCVNRVCNSTYSLEKLLPTCMNSKWIRVNVYAVNILGRSEPTSLMIGKPNNIIHVIFSVISLS